MRVALFEDQAAGQFSPVALLRPVFELLCGHFSARERALEFMAFEEWGAFVRSELAEVYREEHTDCWVNDHNWLSTDSTLLINGRWLADPKTLASIRPDDVGIVDGTVVYITVDPLEVPLLMADQWDTALPQLARMRNCVSAPGRLLQFPWDLIHHNANQIRMDFAARQLPPTRPTGWGPQVAIVGDPRDVYIDTSARLDPFVVIDATKGPVSIEGGSLVQAFTRLEGPCHIGAKTQLFRANVREGTSIGPICRVGGEIEGAILHGLVNKYHDGFLGHSYVCPWVNLGAMSTNSDLKNDYSNVRVPISGHMVDSGEIKVGCFIGDHTKTAIGSLFNTGTSVGVMCLILPDGELLPKHVPSFSRIWHGELVDGFPLDKGIETARTAMERRNRKLTFAQEQLLRRVHSLTRPERDHAITRSASKVPV